MPLDRIAPPGTEDWAGDDYMNELKLEIERLWRHASVPLTGVAGTNTIAASSDVPITAYANGQKWTLIPVASTTGAATINIDGVGTVNLLDRAGNPSGQNSLILGYAYGLEYFSADPGVRIMTGPGGLGNVSSKAVIVENQQANNVAAGGATSGSYLTHPLNTVMLNELSVEGAALAANDVTLPAGTYDVLAAVPFHQAGLARLRLFNVTDSAAVAGLASPNIRSTTLNEVKTAMLRGRFTITAEKTLRLQYRCSATKATDGLGQAANFTEVEHYGSLAFERVPSMAVGEAVLQGSATYDPQSLVDGAGATTTVTVTGVAVGDFAEASFSNPLQGILVTAWVSAADTVSVRFQNETTGTIDLASGTLRARVRPAA